MRKSVLSILFLLTLSFALDASAERRPGPARPTSAIMGKLAIMAGQGPVLKSGEKTYRLSSADSDLLATLKDSRMADRPVRLEGQFKDANGFDVQRLYVVRGNKSYHVIYYCEVCNLTAFRPGDCVCCQAPLELLEVPLDDPRYLGK